MSETASNLREAPAPGLRRERAGRALRWAALLAAPLLGFILVEAMNFNNVLVSFTPVQLILNLIWYYMLTGALYLLTGRVVLTAGTAAVLFTLVGLANRYVIRFRGRTIFPGDLLTLQTAANVAARYDYTPDCIQLICMAVLAAFLALLFFLPRRKGRQGPGWKRTLVVGLLCGGYLAVFFQTGFLDRLGIEPSLWTTRGNGFLLNFSVCLRYSTVDEPEGYSEEALAELAEEAVPAPAEGTRPKNLIVIMNESLADLTEVLGLETNEDPMPFLHSLTENTVKGTAYSSVFGGTTANSEYEFLTGNTMAFLPEGTVPYHMYVTDGSPSLVGQLGRLGYRGIAMHPYLSSGWNRVPVYEDFGFEKSLFQRDLQDCGLIREYVSDRSNYENLIRIYEEEKEGGPLFLFNVTMQNHSAYNVPWKNLERTVWLTGAREGRYKTVDQYLSLVRESDNAFRYLVDYFSGVEEPTMILMFGDHQPQVTPNFYTDVLGGQFTDLTAAVQQRKQAVPFVLWANYDIQEESGITLSLNYLSTLLCQKANLPLTGYQGFLARAYELAPVVNGVGFRDGAGNWYKRRGELPDEVKDMLDRYEMLQYNQLFDPENRMADFFTLGGEGIE